MKRVDLVKEIVNASSWVRPGSCHDNSAPKLLIKCRLHRRPNIVFTQGIFSTFMVTPSGAATASYGCKESPVNTGGNFGAAPNMLPAKKARKLSCADFLAGPAARPVLMAGDVDTCSLAISVKHKKYRHTGRPPLTHMSQVSKIVSYGFYGFYVD